MKKQILTPTYIIAAFIFSACGASKETLAKAQKMSCSELAMKIGQLQQQVKTEEVNGIISNIEGDLSKKDEDITSAAIDGLFSSIGQSTAEEQLKQYMAIYNKKGCK